MACWAYTCLDVCKNHLLIFSSFLDVWENVEWPRFFGPPCTCCVEHSSQPVVHGEGNRKKPPKLSDYTVTFTVFKIKYLRNRIS